ncbi:MAG: hypothetical protein HQK54_08375 [Oligoflexales bacterium]|nr:hypothetical protein [Oligoflexales bacterium]
MYLTAHRVISPAKQEGINSFIHCHGSTGIDWYGDVSKLPENNPGHLLKKNIAIPPGGNRVRSFLDVLCSDAAGVNKIVATLIKFREELTQRHNPTLYSHSGITIRFGVEDGLMLQRENEFDQLYAVATTLLMER